MRVEVIGLHPRQGLAVAEVVPGSLEADGAHGFQADRILVHLDAAHTSQRLADQIVAQDKAFVAEAHERGMHARRLVDHVEPGKPGHHVRDRLLPSRLHIGQLGIRHARGGAAGQPVELVHLGATGSEQRLFARAARHRAGAQIADERPGAENRRVAGADGVDIDHPRQALRHRLSDGPGDGGGGGGAGLSGRQEQHRHAGADHPLHH